MALKGNEITVSKEVERDDPNAGDGGVELSRRDLPSSRNGVFGNRQLQVSDWQGQRQRAGKSAHEGISNRRLQI